MEVCRLEENSRVSKREVEYLPASSTTMRSLGAMRDGILDQGKLESCPQHQSVEPIVETHVDRSAVEHKVTFNPCVSRMYNLRLEQEKRRQTFAYHLQRLAQDGVKQTMLPKWEEKPFDAAKSVHWWSLIRAHMKLRSLEDLGCAAYAVGNAKDMLSVACIVNLYARTLGAPSLGEVFSKILSESCGWSNQALPEFGASLNGLNSAWVSFTKGPNFARLVKVIGMTTALFCLKDAKMDFTTENVSTYCNGVISKAFDTTNFATLVLSVASDFLEFGYRIFVKMDWKSVLFGSSEMDKLDEKWRWFMTHKNDVVVGNCEQLFAKSDDHLQDEMDALETALERVMLQIPRANPTRVFVEKRLLDLQRLSCDFRARRAVTGLRKSPFAIMLSGKSSVGKSGLCSLLIASLRDKYPLGELEDTVVLNESDKYESNVRSNTKVIILDDVSNVKSTHAIIPPTDRIIRIINNITQTAVMPEAGDKGKVQIKPRLVMVTTNVEDLESRAYSNEPASILRRMIHVSVKVKPQFCQRSAMKNGTSLDPSRIPDELVPDIWDLTVTRVVVTDSSYNKVLEIDEDGPMENVSVHRLLRYARRAYGKHDQNQDTFMARQLDLQSLAFCQNCEFPVSSCGCSNLSVAPMCTVCKKPWMNCECPPRMPTNQALPESKCSKEAQVGVFWTQPQCNLAMVSRCVWFLSMLRLMHSVSPGRYNWLYVCWALSVLVPMLSVSVVGFYVVYFVCVTVFWIRLLYSLVSRDSSRFSYVDNAWRLLKEWYWNHNRQLVLAAGVIAIIGLALKSKFLFTKLVWTEQGNLCPSTVEEIAVRNDEPNPWRTVKPVPPPTSAKSKTVTSDVLVGLVRQNLVHVTTESGATWNLLFIRSNVAIGVAHTFVQTDFSRTMLRSFPINCVRYNREGSANGFKTIISVDHSVLLGDTDMRVYYLANCPSFKDLTSYFPIEVGCPPIMRWVRKGPDGNSIDYRVSASRSGHVVSYKLPIPTRVGLCGAVLVAETRAPFIMGVHCRGVVGASNAQGEIVTVADIFDAVQRLNCVPGAVVPASDGDFPTQRYGVQTLSSGLLHEKSPMNFLAEVPERVVAYGSTPTRSTAKSVVKSSLLSPHVEEVFGVPQLWGPPKFRGVSGREPWAPWRTDLQHLSTGIGTVCPNLVSRACEDYVLPLASKMRQFFSDEKPLTYYEVVNGVPNRRFIRGMNMSSSPGFPFSGAKRNMFVPDPQFEGKYHLPLHVVDEVERAEKLLLGGERYYSVFKCSLKDEPTKLTKDKVRVFAGADLVLQVLLRKYFLPIVQLLSIFPLESECAVGLNCESNEWTQLHDWFNDDRFSRAFGGDYAAYDKKMSEQFVAATLWCYIYLAQFAQYSDKDLHLMRMITAELTRPLYFHNGDVLEVIGSNPSGNNLTVYVNSTANSLLQRCVFFTQYPENRNFRKYVRLTTYGDDVKGGVSHLTPRYNNVTVAEFMGSIGMKFTMPDKNSEMTEITPIEQQDFLKRKSVAIPELIWERHGQNVPVVVGALDEASIFKMLHCTRDTPWVTPLELAIDTVAQANRHWFFHGRRVFEARNAQLRELACRVGLEDTIESLSYDFDHWVREWNERNNPQEMSDVSSDEGLDNVPTDVISL